MARSRGQLTKILTAIAQCEGVEIAQSGRATTAAADRCLTTVMVVKKWVTEFGWQVFSFVQDAVSGKSAVEAGLIG